MQTVKCLLQGGVRLSSVCYKVVSDCLLQGGVRLSAARWCQTVKCSTRGVCTLCLETYLQTIGQNPQQPHPNINAIPASDSEMIGFSTREKTKVDNTMSELRNYGCVCMCVCAWVCTKKKSSLTLFFFIQFFVCPKDIPRAGVGSHLEQRPIGSGIHSRLGLTTPVQTSRPGSSVKSRLEWVAL